MLTGTLIVILLVISAGSITLLTGCAAPGVESYKGETPKLDIREYLNGKLKAFGTIQDFTGKTVSRFTVDIDASWDGNVGTLKEDFVFASGETEERTWTLTMQDDHHFTGQAHDVIGTAKGKQYGNSLNMHYTLEREINGRNMHFSMDDWMFLVNENYLINKTKMKKIGIPVATLTIGFHKVDE